MNTSTNTCVECSWFADDNDCAKCENCHAMYHKACLKMPETDKVPLNWRCSECQSASENKTDEIPVTRALSDVIDDKDSVQDSITAKDSKQALQNNLTAPELNPESEPNTEKIKVPFQRSEFNLLMEEIKALRTDIKTSTERMELEMASIKLCVHTCISRVDSLESRLFAVVDKTSVPHSVVPESAKEVVEIAQCEVSDYDEELLGSDNIDISEMPEHEEQSNSTQSQLEPIATKLASDRSLVVVRPYSTTDYKMEPTIEQYVGKRYKLKSSENFEEYLKYIGVGLIGRKTACAVTPISILTREGDVYTFTMATTFRTITFSFKFNEEFAEERPDGCQLKSRMLADGNVLIHTQIEPNGRKSVHKRTFTPESLIVETTADGWDHTCIRAYEAVP